ncbi:hypothetical protein KCU71_g20106, partial [Aureobasidium melanogenum]
MTFSSALNRNERWVMRSGRVAYRTLCFWSAYHSPKDTGGVNFETIQDPPQPAPDFDFAVGNIFGPFGFIKQPPVCTQAMIKTEILVRHSIVVALRSQKHKHAIRADLVQTRGMEVHRNQSLGLDEKLLCSRSAVCRRHVVTEESTASDMLGTESTHTGQAHLVRFVCRKRAISPSNPKLTFTEEWKTVEYAVKNVYCQGNEASYIGWMVSRYTSRRPVTILLFFKFEVDVRLACGNGTSTED